MDTKLLSSSHTAGSLSSTVSHVSPEDGSGSHSEGRICGDLVDQLRPRDRLGPVCDTHSFLNTGKQRRARVCSTTVDKMILMNIEVLLSERFSIPASIFV